MVDPQKELINELKVSVQESEGAFEIEKPLSEDELEEVSGGQCLCHCAFDSGGGGSCGGGGGGGSTKAFEEEPVT